jgi:hypothetical protein
MMLVSFGEKQETTRERRAVVERKREQGNEGVATAEMRRNIGILLRVEKGKKSYKQQRQRQRKLRRRRPTMKLKFITCFFGILEL